MVITSLGAISEQDALKILIYDPDIHKILPNSVSIEWKNHQQAGSKCTALLYWNILLGIVGVSLISILYPLITAFAMGEGESGILMGASVVFTLVGGVIQVIAVSIFILICLLVRCYLNF